MKFRATLRETVSCERPRTVPPEHGIPTSMSGKPAATRPGRYPKSGHRNRLLVGRLRADGRQAGPPSRGRESGADEFRVSLRLPQVCQRAERTVVDDLDEA